MSETFDKSQMSESFDVPAGCLGYIGEIMQEIVNIQKKWSPHFQIWGSTNNYLKLVRHVQILNSESFSDIQYEILIDWVRKLKSQYRTYSTVAFNSSKLAN